MLCSDPSRFGQVFGTGGHHWFWCAPYRGPVVGTGVDPVTSRFQAGEATFSCSRRGQECEVNSLFIGARLLADEPAPYCAGSPYFSFLWARYGHET